MRRLLARGWHAVRHPVSQNAAALSAVQFATFFVPLVTLPYLSRTLGPEGFGEVVFAQGFAVLVGLVIDFGLGYAAGRDVATVREDRSAIARIAARVLAARLLLVGVSAVVAVVLVAAIPAMRPHPELFALAWVAAVANGMSPAWYFLGIEQMRLVSVITFVVRVLGAGLVFVAVQDAGDGWIVLLLFAVTSTSLTLISTGLMYEAIAALRPPMSQARALLREARQLFVGTTAIALYSSAAVVLLGVVASSTQVARYGAADRVVRAGLQLFGPVTMAVFPRLTYLHSHGAEARARKLAWTTMAVLGGVGTLCALGLILLAEPLMRIVFGDEFAAGAGALRVLVLILPVLAVAQTIAGGWMLANRMDADIVRAVVRAAVTVVVLGLALGAAAGATGMAVAVVVSELVALGGCAAAVRRHDRSARVPLFPAHRLVQP